MLHDTQAPTVAGGYGSARAAHAVAPPALACPLPVNEVERLIALARYHVLDTPPEPGYEDLTTLAAMIARQPAALISLVGEQRQWFKSRHGFRIAETPRDVAFCAHAVLGSDPLIVRDATLDARFRHFPLVTQAPFVRFYAGFPLVTPDGYALGTLCVIGYAPGDLAGEQIEALKRLARQVMTQLELRRVTRELELALEVADRAGLDARRLAEARANFLSAASHEMLTPLNAVVGLSELLLGTKLPRDQHALCRDIHDSGQHLQTLLTSMLDLAALEHGSVELERGPVDLRCEVGHVFDMLRPVATPKAVQLVLEPATEAACRRIGDARRLRQILGHLVDNAVKFTHGGVVRVRVTEEPVAAGSAAVRVDVEDCGTGIAPELLARIFEKFTQADDTSTRLHGGLGLGLAITRLLVRAMGGTLAVTSTLGSGSTFSALLPLDAQDDISEPETAHQGERLRGLRVLVADDNEVNRLLIVRLLRRLGCKTVVACNGVEALAVSPKDYDFVLMDCQMPVMDGFEAARAMRQREAEGLATHKPIVAVTASVTAHDRLRCSDHGMDDYMTKPLTGVALKQVMLRHLGLGGHTTRAPAIAPSAVALATADAIPPVSGS